MPDTFKGRVWSRPVNPQWGHNADEVAERAGFDHQPGRSSWRFRIPILVVSAVVIAASFLAVWRGKG